MIPSNKDNSWRYITLAAAAMLMITMGARQAQGLFVFPISGSTGVSIVAISFAMAVGQFMWGLAQPVAGACADRFGFTPRVDWRRTSACGGHGADAVFYQQLWLGGYDRISLCRRLRRGELFGHDRRAGAALGAKRARDGVGTYHRRRILRSIPLCADYPEINLDLGLDGRDVVPRRHRAAGVASGQNHCRDRAPWRRVR